jgi:hypothetical protein
MVAWVAPALQAAGAVLGILGKRKSRKQESSVDLVALRDEAQRAGFNPVTALQATGGGFSSQTMPGLSSMEMLGGVMGAAGDFFAATDPVRLETQRQELELAKTQLQIAQQELAAGGTGFGSVPRVPSSATGGPTGGGTGGGFGPTLSSEELADIELTVDAGDSVVEVGNPNFPIEPEATLMGVAVEGRDGAHGGIVDWTTDLIGANLDPRTEEFFRAYVDGLKPSTYLDAIETGVQTLRDFQQTPGIMLDDGGRRYEMWKAQQNYPSSIRRP